MWVAVVVGKAGCGAVDKRVALAAEIRSTISAAATPNVHEVLGSPPMSARLGIAGVKQLKLAVDQHRRPRVAPLVIVIDRGVEGVGMMRPQLGFIREKRRGCVPPAGALFSSGPLWIMLVVGVKDTIFNIESVGVIQSATRRCKVETWAETAKLCSTDGRKGRGVRIVGRLKQDRWKGNDGKNYSRIKVVADNVAFRPMSNIEHDDSREAVMADAVAEPTVIAERTTVAF